MNFAAVHKLPVVFVIENNLIAISTRFERQTAVKNIADKAAAYGMHGPFADGMDVLDSYAKTRQAATHAPGRGPSPASSSATATSHTPATTTTCGTAPGTKSASGGRRIREASAQVSPGAGVTEPDLATIRAALDTEIEAAIAQAESEPDPRPEDAMPTRTLEGQPLPDGTRS